MSDLGVGKMYQILNHQSYYFIQSHSELAKKKKSSHSLRALREVVGISRRTDTLTTRAGCTRPVE